MEPYSKFKIFNIATVFFAMCISLATSSPTPGSVDAWATIGTSEDYSHFTSLEDIPKGISARDDDWREGDIGAGFNEGMFQGWVYCRKNPVPTQCTFTIFDTEAPDMRDPKIWLFDSNCNVLAQDLAAPRALLEDAEGYTLRQRPLNVHYNRKDIWKTRDIHWTYNGKVTDPANPTWEFYNNGRLGYSHLYGAGWDNITWNMFRWAFGC
ncbi:hypothetical protein ONS96_007739 [Cadophora gregata f. sp. sojae]|nr:hypothetical protein ONS96_007739 [Cadophora gregata f. sp. sojae]